MHVQKNVFESLIGILLDIETRTKEGLNSRFDKVQIGIKKDLHPILQKMEVPSPSSKLQPQHR